MNAGSDVFAAVTMKKGVFGDVTPCSSCKTDVSEDCIISIIRVTRIGELGTKIAVTSTRRTLQKKYYVRKEGLVWNTRFRMNRGM
jgi:hypothetical protein